MALAVVAVLAAIAAAGPPHDARAAGAMPAAAAQAPTEAPRLELRGQTPFVAPTGTLELRLALRDAPADSTLSFEVQAPITNSQTEAPRALLDNYIAGKTLGRFQAPKSVLTALVATDAEGVATVKLQITPEGGPEPEFGFKLADGGVYPLIVTLSGGDQTILGSFITYLVRLPGGAPSPDAPPLQVAGILPFRAPLAINTQGQSTLDDDGIKRLSEITRIAQAHRSTPLTLVPNAETVAALGLVGDRAGANAPAGLAAAWAGHQVMTSTFVPVDVDAWMASQMTDELRQQLRLGTDTVGELAGGAQPLDERTWLADPTLSASSVRALHQAGRDRAVLPPDSVAPLDPKTYKPEQAQVVNLEPFDIETDGTRTRAVITEDRFRARFSATANPALNAQIAMADLAVLYFGAEKPLTRGGLAPSTRQRSVTAVLPEDRKSLTAVDAFLTALEQPVGPILEGGGRPIVQAFTTDAVLNGEPAPQDPAAPRSATPTTSPAPTSPAPTTPPTTATPRTEPQAAPGRAATTVPAAPPGSAVATTDAGASSGAGSGAGSAPASTVPATRATARPEATPALVRGYTPRGTFGATTMGSYPERLAAARVSLAGYDSMVRDSAPELVTPLEQLIDVSGSAQLNPEQRQAYLDAATATVVGAANNVRPQAQENVTITDSRTQLSLNIQNDNPYPVAVKVALTSDKMQFPDGDQPPANSRTFVTTLVPGLNKVPVEVSANTSGEIQVTSKLSSPDEQIVLAGSKFTVRSTLISGLGLALSLGAGFFLLLWWARNFRKTRRANKLVATDDDPADPDRDDPDDPDDPDDATERAGGRGAGAAGAAESTRAATERQAADGDPPVVDLLGPADVTVPSDPPRRR